MWWQWHQLDHMQNICTSLKTDDHAVTSPVGRAFMVTQKTVLSDVQTYI